MKISILTLFPDMFSGVFDYSIIKNAKNKGQVKIELLNIRDYGHGKHKVVDDTPYGGGIGMVLKVDVLYNAINHAKCRKEKLTQAKKNKKCNEKIVLLSAGGNLYKQNVAMEYAKLDHLILICGHYEGVDERITHFIDEEISVGEFILTGGELPAMLITDSVVRLISGVLKKGATDMESFSYNPDGIPLLEYPQYTKPAEFHDLKVPEVLLSGNHAKIADWRKNEAKAKSKKRLIID